MVSVKLSIETEYQHNFKTTEHIEKHIYIYTRKVRVRIIYILNFS